MALFKIKIFVFLLATFKTSLPVIFHPFCAVVLIILNFPPNNLTKSGYETQNGEGKITVNEYQEAIPCIRRTAQRDLEELVVKGIIKAVAKSATDPTKRYVLL